MRSVECLEGLELQGGWRVLEIIKRPPHATGGFFSVGYRVRDESGRIAYMKALDFAAAFQTNDPARFLQKMTEAYNFERDLLYKCKSRKLRRVVTPLADGNVNAPGSLTCPVHYLIFEHADGDIRDAVASFMESQFDLAWCLRSLHNIAVGLMELHGIGIAHQDLKPSNVLVFSESGSKITDLGRASDRNGKAQTDSFQIPGDTSGSFATYCAMLCCLT